MLMLTQKNNRFQPSSVHVAISEYVCFSRESEGLHFSSFSLMRFQLTRNIALVLCYSQNEKETYFHTVGQLLVLATTPDCIGADCRNNFSLRSAYTSETSPSPTLSLRVDSMDTAAGEVNKVGANPPVAGVVSNVANAPAVGAVNNVRANPPAAGVVNNVGANPPAAPVIYCFSYYFCQDGALLCLRVLLN